MKKILMLCLLAYATNAVAQKETINVDSLIKNKSFTFVVNGVKPQVGVVQMKSNSVNRTESFNVNAALVAPSYREKVSSIQIAGKGEYVQQYYDRIASLDAGYQTAFQNSGKISTNRNNAYSIYYIQEHGQLLLNDMQFPINLENIKDSDFASYLTSNYTLRSVKKKNGKWALTYRVKDGSKKRIFYLDVEPDGSALLTQTGGVLYGFIMPSK